MFNRNNSSLFYNCIKFNLKKYCIRLVLNILTNFFAINYGNKIHILFNHKIFFDSKFS